MTQANKTAAPCCYLHTDKVLASPAETFIVSKGKIPEVGHEFSGVIEQKVCGECSKMLRELGFRTFNLQMARDRAAEKRQNEAGATIRQLLAARGQALPTKKS